MGADVKADAGARRAKNRTGLLPRWGWLLLGLSTVILLGGLGLAVFWGPDQLVVQGKASPDAYLKALTDTRATLVQVVGGVAVALGVVVGLLTLVHNREQLQRSQLQHEETLDANQKALEQTLSFNRESLTRTLDVTERGQFTERFSRAIEQLGRSGQNDVDLRLGGIYALEQIARESATWSSPVVEVLAAFVRQHVTGKPEPEGTTVKEQEHNLWVGPSQGRFGIPPADIEAALSVLSRRDRTTDKTLADFSYADFCRLHFPTGSDLRQSNFSHARMQFASLYAVDLRNCSFVETDLRGAFLDRADLRATRFFRGRLDAADLKNARLDGASFQMCDLSGVLNVTIDQLKLARFDRFTRLPENIDLTALDRSLE